MTREEVEERCKEFAEALAGALEAARAEFKLTWRVDVPEGGRRVCVASDEFTITLRPARAWGRVNASARLREGLRKYVTETPEATVDAARDRRQVARHIINRVARPMAALAVKAREREALDAEAGRRRDEAAALILAAGGGLLALTTGPRAQGRRNSVWVTSGGQAGDGLNVEGEVEAESCHLKISNLSPREAAVLARVVSALVERRGRGEGEVGDGCDWLELVA